MQSRSTSSIVTFYNAFTLRGYQVELPPGDYEVIVEEERLQGISFEAYRRTGTFLMVRGHGKHVGQTTLQAIAQADLDIALDRDRVLSDSRQYSEAALPPLEDTT